MALCLATKGLICIRQIRAEVVEVVDTGGGDWIDLPRPQRVYYKSLMIKKRKPIIRMRLENESDTG